MSRARYSALAALAVTAAILATTRPPAVSAAAPPARYSVIDLGVLPGYSTTATWWQGNLNENGEIAGYCNNGYFNYDLTHDNFPAIWSPNRGLQPLSLLPGKHNAIANCVNGNGLVAGVALNNYHDIRAVTWYRGQIQRLPTLPGDTVSEALGMNQRGVISGYSAGDDPSGPDFYQGSAVHPRPVYWENGQIHQLPGGIGSAGWVNDRGHFVGGLQALDGTQDAVLWGKKGITAIGKLAGGNYAFAVVANNQDQVIGYGTTALGEFHGWYWENGVLTDLGTRGGSYSFAWDLNDRGQIVGEAENAAAEERAVLWQGGASYDLNDLIPADSGWVLVFAIGVNNRGQIAGVGIHDEQYRSFLLTPTR